MSESLETKINRLRGVDLPPQGSLLAEGMGEVHADTAGGSAVVRGLSGGCCLSCSGSQIVRALQITDLRRCGAGSLRALSRG